jgi:hypothetical protein
VKTSATARHLKIDRQYPFVECGQHAFLEPAAQQHALCRIASLHCDRHDIRVEQVHQPRSAVRLTSPDVLQFAPNVEALRHCP